MLSTLRSHEPELPVGERRALRDVGQDRGESAAGHEIGEGRETEQSGQGRHEVFMVNERPVRIIALLLTLVTLTSCATVSLQLYDGPPRPGSEVSVVRLWGQAGIVQKVDGKDAGVRGTESHAYLLPGDHTFEIKMMRIQAYHVLCGMLCDSIFNKPRVVMFRTEAGHAYTFKTLDDEAVTIVIEDKGTSWDPLCLDPRRYREGNNC